jgi:hypothetical protein
MDVDALGTCLVSTSCLVTQGVSGLIVGMLLFLVAAGLTLIFPLPCWPPPWAWRCSACSSSAS